MEIKINILNESKMVNCKIINLPDNYEHIFWSFIDVGNTNVDIFHSTNAPEGTFLNYNPENAPNIQFTFPQEGTYRLKVTAKVGYFANGSITSYVMNPDGVLEEEVNTGDVLKVKYLESSEFSLTQGDNWV